MTPQARKQYYENLFNENCATFERDYEAHCNTAYVAPSIQHELKRETGDQEGPAEDVEIEYIRYIFEVRNGWHRGGAGDGPKATAFQARQAPPSNRVFQRSGSNDADLVVFRIQQPGKGETLQVLYSFLHRLVVPIPADFFYVSTGVRHPVLNFLPLSGHMKKNDGRMGRKVTKIPIGIHTLPSGKATIAADGDDDAFLRDKRRRTIMSQLHDAMQKPPFNREEAVEQLALRVKESARREGIEHDFHRWQSETLELKRIAAGIQVTRSSAAFHWYSMHDPTGTGEMSNTRVRLQEGNDIPQTIRFDSSLPLGELSAVGVMVRASCGATPTYAADLAAAKSTACRRAVMTIMCAGEAHQAVVGVMDTRTPRYTVLLSRAIGQIVLGRPYRSAVANQLPRDAYVERIEAAMEDSLHWRNEIDDLTRARVQQGLVRLARIVIAPGAYRARLRIEPENMDKYVTVDDLYAFVCNMVTWCGKQPTRYADDDDNMEDISA